MSTADLRRAVNSTILASESVSVAIGQVQAVMERMNEKQCSPDVLTLSASLVCLTDARMRLGAVRDVLEAALIVEQMIAAGGAAAGRGDPAPSATAPAPSGTSRCGSDPRKNGKG